MHAGGLHQFDPVYFVTWRPGSSDPGRFDYAACGNASSSTLAKHAIVTDLAPAAFSALTQAVLVAPLVNTSSTNTTCRPAILCARGAAMAPDKTFERFLAPNPPRLGVLFVRTSPSTSSSPQPFFSSSLAIKAAWLKPRSQSRNRCNGTGISSLGSPSFAGIRAAIKRARRGARPILRPCFRARTSLRDTSV